MLIKPGQILFADMKFYENIESERDRIQSCINKFGWTSDHNLDWWTCVIISPDGVPVFVEFDDGTGLLAHKYSDKWRIWSDPLSDKNVAVDKIREFSRFILNGNVKEVWCDDVSDKIYPELKKIGSFRLNKIYYSLLWPVMDLVNYNPMLSGGRFKDIRNAKNKFYREHRVSIVEANKIDKKELYRIIDDWKRLCGESEKGDVYDLRYRLIVNNGFRGFNTARVMLVDNQPVGFNAGYEVPNEPGRFAGVIGIHDYSIKEIGLIMYLEDIEWMKNAGYKFYDMQGSADDGGLKFKMQFNPVIERKTDTFSIIRK